VSAKAEVKVVIIKAENNVLVSLFLLLLIYVRNHIMLKSAPMLKSHMKKV
jgi:hypothetical protein